MMTNLDEFLVIFIIIVVLIGAGWFVYDANRNDKQ